MKVNIPNILTISRICLTPVFYFMLITNNPFYMATASVIFLIAALTDWFDGWYARKYNETSNSGAFLDPLADKLLTSSALYAFYLLGLVELWMVIIIIIRDFGTTFLRIIAEKNGHHLKTSFSAKFKTFYQFTFITYILSIIFFENINMIDIPKEFTSNILYSDYTHYSFLILTIFTVYTLIEYLFKSKHIFKANKN